MIFTKHLLTFSLFSKVFPGFRGSSMVFLKPLLFFFFNDLLLGAGYHSESKAKEYKHVCKRACQRVSLPLGLL